MEKIPEDNYKKALFHLRTQFNAVWNFANCHGLNEGVAQGIEESIKLCEQFAMVTRGKDIPIKVRDTPKKRATE